MFSHAVPNQFKLNAFDNQLTFRHHHIDEAYLNLWKMRDAARRFATELANRPIIIKMYQTYLQPHPDYCCMIWNQNRIGESIRLAEILHKVTAFAISNSRQDHIDYRYYPLRLSDLELLTVRQRIEFLTTTSVLKITKRNNKHLTCKPEQLCSKHRLIRAEEPSSH